MNKLNIENLVVGDEVAYINTYSISFRIKEKGTSKIKRILKTKICLENGKEFNKYGNEIGCDSYKGGNGCWLISMTDLAERVENEKQILSFEKKKAEILSEIGQCKIPEQLDEAIAKLFGK